MSTYINTKCITFMCSCGAMLPLYSLYLCRYCMANRCPACVYHEIDPRYCPHCQETMPSKEANDKLARCNTCYDCPICGYTLIARALTVLSNADSPTEKTSEETEKAKRLYYLACGYCKWTTKLAGIPDKLQISDRWDVYDYENKERLETLFDLYKKIGAQEKLDRERKRYSLNRKKYYSPSDKYSMTSPLIKWGILPGFHPSLDEQKWPQIPASDSVAELPELDSSILQREDISDVTTLPQRLAVPVRQVERKCDLLPIRKQIATKLSKRCKQCQHSLIKGEQTPNSIKFKMHRMAMFYVPDLRVWFHPELVANQSCAIVFTLCNNTDYPVTVSFQAFSHPKSNSEVILPDEKIVLLPAPEYSSHDPAKSMVHVDENKKDWFVQRCANRLALKLHVIPSTGREEVRFSFSFKHNCAVMQEVPQKPVLNSDELMMADIVQNVLVTVDRAEVPSPSIFGLQQKLHEVTVCSLGWPQVE